MQNLQSKDILLILLIIAVVIGYKLYYAKKKKSNRRKGKKEIENTYKSLQEGMFLDIVGEILGANWKHISNRFLEDGTMEDVYHWFIDYDIDKGKVYGARIECRFLDNKLKDKKIVFVK